MKKEILNTEDTLIMMGTKERNKIISKSKKKMPDREWYSLRHMLSYLNWAEMVVLLGGREAGKSYSVTDFFCIKYKHRHIPFYWIRLN